MEIQQQEWINKLLKPKADNEARLFGIETRLGEAEFSRVEEARFTKDVIKKLIYAVEQQH